MANLLFHILLSILFPEEWGRKKILLPISERVSTNLDRHVCSLPFCRKERDRSVLRPNLVFVFVSHGQRSTCGNRSGKCKIQKYQDIKEQSSSRRYNKLVDVKVWKSANPQIGISMSMGRSTRGVCYSARPYITIREYVMVKVVHGHPTISTKFTSLGLQISQLID